jgi:hypothetical protein
LTTGLGRSGVPSSRIEFSGEGRWVELEQGEVSVSEGARKGDDGWGGEAERGWEERVK